MVAPKLSISNEISAADVTQALGSEASIWEFRNSSLGAGTVRHDDDIRRFREFAWRTFDKIQNEYGRDVDLSLCPIKLVSCSGEIVRVSLRTSRLH
ncbi:hypothetical protein [Roseovarius sp. THAF27]|uniref:hypothetical protein n=1 Tax=Roseovarius sp. THAF27 TaxID=2587850 RepID=UPI001C12C14D